MRKLFIHGEYMCILNIVALPFFVIFYFTNTNVFWMLLLFVDIADLILLDKEQLIQTLIDKKHTSESIRIKVYVVLFIICMVYIAWTQPITIFIILLANIMIESGVNVFVRKWQNHFT